MLIIWSKIHCGGAQKNVSLSKKLMYLTVSVAGWHENKMSILNHIMYLVIVMLGQTEGLNFISTLLSENQNIFYQEFYVYSL